MGLHKHPPTPNRVGDQTLGVSEMKVACGGSKGKSVGPSPRPQTKGTPRSTVRYSGQDLCHLNLQTPPTFLLSQKRSKKQCFSLPSGLWVGPANRELRQKSREKSRKRAFIPCILPVGKGPTLPGSPLPSLLCRHLPPPVCTWSAASSPWPP